jgi:hypothetical protein
LSGRQDKSEPLQHEPMVTLFTIVCELIVLGMNTKASSDGR